MAVSMYEALGHTGEPRTKGMVGTSDHLLVKRAKKSEAIAGVAAWMAKHPPVGAGWATMVDKRGYRIGEWKGEQGRWVTVIDPRPRSQRGKPMIKQNPTTSNPAVPLLRRQDAMALAVEVATKGWKHRPSRGAVPEYWEKAVPSGELQIVDANSRLTNYHLQHVSDTGVVTKLGNSRGSLSDAQIKAVLESLRRGQPVVNPQYVRNLAPARTQWIGSAIKHPGKLSKLAAKLGFEKKPFMKRSFAEQKKVMDACVDEYGYRSCLGSAMLLRNLPSISRDPKMSARATALKDYLVRRHGGPGSFGPRRNPPGGEWDAVPVLFMHVDIGKVRLTSRQVTELELETS